MLDHQSSNAVLLSLPQADFGLLRPHLRLVDLLFGDVLVGAGGRVKDVCFPHSGIIAKLLSVAKGGTVEVAMIGRDGVFGGTAALNGDDSPTAAIVRYGGKASVIEIGQFRKLLKQSEPLRNAIMQAILKRARQSEQAVACAASHTVEERLCSRLLQSRDLADSNRFALTQDVMAQTLAVQRNTISLVAHALQRAGSIRYSRGQLEITNVDDLKKRSCDCYRRDEQIRRPPHDVVRGLSSTAAQPVGKAT
jgi:CRP-like cAMP-binding protein